jgi:CheY-like chemotaxis protein
VFDGSIHPQNPLHFRRGKPTLGAMTEPLAILLYETIMPGSQLANRLQGLNYRVVTLNEAGLLHLQAEQLKPMVVLVDLSPRPNLVCEAIARLKEQPATAHVPVIAFSTNHDAALFEQARAAGAAMAVTDVAVLQHLSQLLDQALTQF